MNRTASSVAVRLPKLLPGDSILQNWGEPKSRSSGWSQSTLAVRLFRELMGVRTGVLEETHKRLENMTLRESLGILSSAKLLHQEAVRGGNQKWGLSVCLCVQPGGMSVARAAQEGEVYPRGRGLAKAAEPSKQSVAWPGG